MQIIPDSQRDARNHGSATSGRHVFSVSGLSHTYEATHQTPSRQVLRDVTLSAEVGQFIVVVGQSGCGKTTLLNILADLLETQTGEVRVLGREPHQAQSEMAYMLARDALLPWRTAKHNVEFPLEVRGLPKAERSARAERYLKLVGLEASMKLHPWQLSQGMRQRVALARTWAMEADLLLMDEPFAAVDAQTRRSLQAELLSLWEKRRTSVLFITHDLTEAIALADRIVVMRQGMVVHDLVVPFGRPRDVETLPFEEGYQELWTTLNSALK